MKIDNLKLDFDDVLIKPKRTTLKSRNEVDLMCHYKFKYSNLTWSGIPIMTANMDTTGTMEIYDVLKKQNMITSIHKFYTIEEWKLLYDNDEKYIDYIIPTIGMSERELENFNNLYNEMKNKFKFLCIDIANGYCEIFCDFIKKVRNMYKNIILIGGNVVSGEMTEQLILSGCDIVKVGIGGGSVCTTRIKTGVGCPQLSAIMECSDSAHGLGGKIISDGGCKNEGDIVKAFGAGADFVMVGGLLAGHKESGGELVKEQYLTNLLDEEGKQIIETKIYKIFYGMSSNEAQKKYYGEQKNYRASEGKMVKIPYRGEIINTVNEILGGLRSACTYVGAIKLHYLYKCTTFYRVNNTHNKIFN